MDFENKETLALMAVNDTAAADNSGQTGGEEGDSLSWSFSMVENGDIPTQTAAEHNSGLGYLAKYIRSIQAVEWLLKIDRMKSILDFYFV
jgi:hypothetical protein